MAEQRDLGPEGVFEIAWHQHNPDDWMAEVRDVRTNHRCRVYSYEELERFIQSHLPLGASMPVERKK
jgi:hypothetical protein